MLYANIKKTELYHKLAVSHLRLRLLAKKETRSFRRSLDDKLLNKLMTRLKENFVYSDKKIDIIKEQIKRDSCLIKDLEKNIDMTFKKQFHLFGEKIYDFSEAHDIWNYDPVTKYHFKKKYYSPLKEGDAITEVKIEDLNHIPEIQIPWRMSRMNFLGGLGLLSKVKNKKNYTNTAVQLMMNWIKNDNYLYTVNWISPMTISLMAINWIIHLPLISDAISVKDQKKILVELKLFSHFIHKHLENKWGTSNHYVTNVVALLCLSILFDQKDKATSWAKDIDNLMIKHTNNDGWDFEGSTSYQRFTTELFILAVKVAEKNGIEFSPVFHELLEKRINVIKSITLKDGGIPIIGDNDSSCVFNMDFPNPPSSFTLESIYHEYNKRSDDLNVLYYG